MDNPLFVCASRIECNNEQTLFDYPIHETGIGKINAAMSLTRLLEQYKPKQVINFGSCGNLSDIKLGQVVEVGTVHNDIDVRPFVDYGYTPVNKTGAIKLSDSGICCFTTDSVYDNQRIDYSLKYLEMINKSDIVDMESYALAYVCKQYNIPFRSFKWVSDDGDIANWAEQAAIGYNHFKELVKNL